MDATEADETDVIDLMWWFSERLYRESRQAWFEFESMRQRLMKQTGMPEEDALEIMCRILLIKTHNPPRLKIGDCANLGSATQLDTSGTARATG